MLPAEGAHPSHTLHNKRRTNQSEIEPPKNPNKQERNNKIANTTRYTITQGTKLRGTDPCGTALIRSAPTPAFPQIPGVPRAWGREGDEAEDSPAGKRLKRKAIGTSSEQNTSASTASRGPLRRFAGGAVAFMGYASSSSSSSRHQHCRRTNPHRCCRLRLLLSL